MNSKKRASYEANKREMFDGMRAYHQSEISHLNHAITILLAVLGAVGAAVLALFLAEEPHKHLPGIAWGLSAVVIALSLTVAITSHLKITSDHKTYEEYGKEYQRTSELLGFYKCMRINREATLIKTNRNIGQGDGYRKTQMIIWSFAIELIIFALLFAICFCHFTMKSHPGSTVINMF